MDDSDKKVIVVLVRPDEYAGVTVLCMYHMERAGRLRFIPSSLHRNEASIARPRSKPHQLGLEHFQYIVEHMQNATGMSRRVGNLAKANHRAADHDDKPQWR